MYLLLLLSSPFLISLIIGTGKQNYRTILGALLFISLIYPLSILANYAVKPVVVLPVLFEASWAYHPYTLVTTCAFLLLGGIVIIFNDSLMDKQQLMVIGFAISSTLGITFANSYITFILSWELLTVATALIIFTDRTHKNALGTVFLITHLVAGLSLLFGILLHFNVAGSLEIVPPVAGTVFFILGIGTKAAFIPLHFWLPNTYPKVSPGATIALSIFTTKAGIFALARILPPMEIVAYIGGIMALYGVYRALQQTTMRSLLCYHIISQLGYMIASISIGSEIGMNGGLLHLLNHMVYKTLLLMIAAAVIYLYGSDNLCIRQRKPWWLVIMALIASFAIIGLPPLNGFISKSLIKYATSGMFLQLIVSIASVGTALSFAKFLYFGFLRDALSQPLIKEVDKRLPNTAVVAMTLLAGLTIAFGVNMNLISALLPYPFLSPYSFKAISASLQIAALGFVIFLFVRPLLDPANHHDTRTASQTVAKTISMRDYLINAISKLEDQLTSLANAPSLLVSITAIILTLFIVFFN